MSIDSDSKSSPGVLSTLGGKDAKIKVHLEITLNLPRTKSFMNKRQIGQQNEYLVRYNLMLSSIRNRGYKANEQQFENCKDGTIHLHALVLLWLDPKLSFVGFLCDLVKVYLATLGKKDSNFNEKYINYFDDDNTIVYRCPSVKIALCIGQKDRAVKWREYLRKTL